MDFETPDSNRQRNRHVPRTVNYNSETAVKLMNMSDAFEIMVNNVSDRKNYKLGLFDASLDKMEREVDIMKTSEKKLKRFNDIVNDLRNLRAKIATNEFKNHMHFFNQTKNFEQTLTITKKNYEDQSHKNQRNFDKRLDDVFTSTKNSKIRLDKNINNDFADCVEITKSALSDIRVGVETEVIKREEGMLLIEEQILFETSNVKKNMENQKKITNESSKK